MTSNDQALQAFLAAKAEIDTMLGRLKTLSDDHFETSPDMINWGNVTTLHYYRDQLRALTDKAFHEGEYAA